MAETSQDPGTVVGRCSVCGSDDLWAWYDVPERQTISVEIIEGKATLEYMGCTKATDAGPDTSYYCGNCMRETDTLEELVGLPPAGEEKHVTRGA